MKRSSAAAGVSLVLTLLITGCGQTRSGTTTDSGPAPTGDLDVDTDTDADSDSDGDSDSDTDADTDTETDSGTETSDVCADVCADETVNPSDSCGMCLLSARVTYCDTAYQECSDDLNSGGDVCLHCSEFLAQCSHDSCPDTADLCPSSATILSALNTCLCHVCGGGQMAASVPGFVHCSTPAPPASSCVGLDKASCLGTAGCRGVFSEPCLGTADCSPYIGFAHCMPTEGTTPATGSCSTLTASSCATREDCIAVHESDNTNCCPQPSWAEPFIECRVEPTPPSESLCNDAQDFVECLDSDGCTLLFEALNLPCYCGPYLCSGSGCQACWNFEYMSCMDSWS